MHPYPVVGVVADPGSAEATAPMVPVGIPLPRRPLDSPLIACRGWAVSVTCGLTTLAVAAAIAGFSLPRPGDTTDGTSRGPLPTTADVPSRFVVGRPAAPPAAPSIAAPTPGDRP